jgi:hypothetical protein
MSNPIRIFWLASIAVALCTPASRAQDTDSSGVPAPSAATTRYPSLSQSESDIKTAADSGQAPAVDAPLVPDTRPLTGAENLTLGYSNVRSFLLPSMNLTAQIDRNPPASGYNTVTSVSYLLGRLTLHHVSGRSQLSLDYAGGAAISRFGTNTNSTIQDLGFSENFDWRRWSVLLAEQSSYLTESPFGFGGVGGLGFLGNVSPSGLGGALGAASPSLQTVLTPSQTIPTTGVARLSTTVVGQAEYYLSRRSSWTAAGSYGLLRFFRAGYTNSSDALFQTGYNYQIDRQSTIAVLYRFDAFRFTHLAQGIDDQVVQLSYARRVTGRLSFQIAAGPDMRMFQVPSSGSSSHVSWSLHSGLNYQLKDIALQASYDYFLTSGSGVLVGAQTDQVTGTAGRDLTRTWQGSISLGYASNRSLAQTTPNTGEGRFSNWYGAVRFSRHLRPGTDLFLAYGARLQGTNTALCAGGPTCGTNSISHEISLGFNWGLRPIALP